MKYFQYNSLLNNPQNVNNQANGVGTKEDTATDVPSQAPLL